MLVYANHFTFRGSGAEDAFFRALGGWLKEQLGFGLHPAQLRQPRTFQGQLHGVHSFLRIHLSEETEPKLYSWVLTKQDEKVQGRQWIAEIGLKVVGEEFEFSCVLRIDQISTQVESPISASRPRIITYIINNIRNSDTAEFGSQTIGLSVKHVGDDISTYQALDYEINWKDRTYPLILVSPTSDNKYLLDLDYLQNTLIGIAQVIQVNNNFDIKEMISVLDKKYSAWGGALNIVYPPSKDGFVYSKFFLTDAIEKWGLTNLDKNSELLGIITHITNISNYRNRIRREGVMQLSIRRKMRSVFSEIGSTNEDSIRERYEETTKEIEENYESFFDSIANENAALVDTIDHLQQNIRELENENARCRYDLNDRNEKIQKLESKKINLGDYEKILSYVLENKTPTPVECLNIIYSLYDDKCVILDSALNSAHESELFTKGRELLNLLKRLVNEYRNELLIGGDANAKRVFGQNQFAAKESKTIMNNKKLKECRIFDYDGILVEMFKHLKIGADDDIRKTIRVHFYWDADKKKIVIGYCGKHLPI